MNCHLQIKCLVSERTRATSKHQTSVFNVLQVPADVKSKIEGKMKEMRDAIATENVTTMKPALEALQQEVMQMGQAMYQQGGGAGPAGGAGPTPGNGAGAQSGPGAGGKGGDDVIDAEFSDKN